MDTKRPFVTLVRNTIADTMKEVEHYVRNGYIVKTWFEYSKNQYVVCVWEKG